MNEAALINRLSKNFNFDLEGGLKKLCEYGKPRLSSQGNGQWYCSLDMYVQGKGVEFKIASDFTHPSMLEAVQICYERLEKVLKDLDKEAV